MRCFIGFTFKIDHVQQGGERTDSGGGGGVGGGTVTRLGRIPPPPGTGTLMSTTSDLVNVKKTQWFWASSYLNVGVLPVYISFGKIREVLQVQQKSSRSVFLQAAPCPVTLNPWLRRWNMRNSGLSVTRPQLNGGAAFCIDIILHKTKQRNMENIRLVVHSTY